MSDDEKVASLDPLGADAIMAQVPSWNATANIDEMGRALRQMCTVAAISTRNHHQLLAIVRDIGIMLGSIRRHGVEPIPIVPEVKALLLCASRLTELIPRDTLMHYSVWNPGDGRLRRYTDHAQEPDLIASIRSALPPIRDATRHLFEVRDYALNHQRTLRSFYLIAHCLNRLVKGFHHALRHVEPAVFIQHFRPYFEPITIDTSQYRGPGAVTMPLHLFDFLFWGSSEQDARYQQFTLDYVPYNTGEFRQYYCRARNTLSFIDRFEAALARPKPALAVQLLISPVMMCMKRVRAFRSAHLSYAAKAYHGATSHSFATGSGGHTTSDLEHLATLTEIQWERLDTMRQRLDTNQEERRQKQKPTSRKPRAEIVVIQDSVVSKDIDGHS